MLTWLMYFVVFSSLLSFHNDEYSILEIHTPPVLEFQTPQVSPGPSEQHPPIFTVFLVVENDPDDTSLVDLGMDQRQKNTEFETPQVSPGPSEQHPPIFTVFFEVENDPEDTSLVDLGMDQRPKNMEFETPQVSPGLSEQDPLIFTVFLQVEKDLHNTSLVVPGMDQRQKNKNDSGVGPSETGWNWNDFTELNRYHYVSLGVTVLIATANGFLFAVLFNQRMLGQVLEMQTIEYLNVFSSIIILWTSIWIQIVLPQPSIPVLLFFTIVFALLGVSFPFLRVKFDFGLPDFVVNVGAQFILSEHLLGKLGAIACFVGCCVAMTVENHISLITTYIITRHDGREGVNQRTS